jgi:hypothetical protein
MYLDEFPTAYFDKIAYYLFDRYRVKVSVPTISRLLKEFS